MIVDAHEDLAWNMLSFGRDYTCGVAERRRLEAGTPVLEWNGHTLLGWPDWIEAGVGLVFAVLFAAPARKRKGAWETVIYHDEEEAHRLYRKELELYHRWVDANPEKFCLITSRQALKRHRETWAGGEAGSRRLGLILLMEGADGIRHPDELPFWYEGGVRILGPAWAGTRYAGGTSEPGPLTRLGRQLLEAAAEASMILDMSHLSEEAALQATDMFPGRLLASHSNPRRLLQHSLNPDRHLSDQVIRSIVERKGVIGIVLGNKFLKDAWTQSDRRDAVGLDDVIRHIDYVCQLAGDAKHVGIGSDFDGGFGLDQVPIELNAISDLRRIGEALANYGYEESDAEAVLGENWLNLLAEALPED